MNTDLYQSDYRAKIRREYHKVDRLRKYLQSQGLEVEHNQLSEAMQNLRLAAESETITCRECSYRLIDAVEPILETLETLIDLV